MILVTGATGFVGSAVISIAASRGLRVRGAARHPGEAKSKGVEVVKSPDLAQDADWHDALRGIDAVVHTAGRVHVMRDTVSEPLAEFRRVNVDGTLTLARTAAAEGVRRFVFISSVKVNGEQNVNGRAFQPNDPAAPEGPYAVSKYEAEKGLYRIGQETGLEIVIIRPPLIYGPGVGANFLALMRAVERGTPLPLRSVKSQRSLIGLTNLVDFILLAAAHPRAVSETFLVSDGEDLALPELIRRIGRAMDRPARLVPVAPWILAAMARMVGKRDLATRLLGSLMVDSSKGRSLLGWLPPLTVDEGLRETVASLRTSTN